MPASSRDAYDTTPPNGLSSPLLPYGLSTYASQATVNPIKSSENCRKTTTNQPGIEQIPIPTSQTSFPEGEGKGALVSSRHRTCLSMKDRCNHQCFLAFTDLSINELTQHDDTVRIKAYQADVTKKVPGLQMSNTG